MITSGFEYYRPSSLNEASEVYNQLDSQDKNPIYYAGGTEILSLARMNGFSSGAVIDIKEIPDCNVHNEIGNEIVVGCAVTLTDICEKNLFSPLTNAARNIADHTSRNKITLGGNICGKIIYKETILPLLTCDSTVLIHGPNGSRRAQLKDVFNKTLNLQKGEFLVQVITEKQNAAFPYMHIKRTKLNIIDYPILSLSLIKKDNRVHAAFSGICEYPFRSESIENILNDKNLNLNSRIENILKAFPANVINNIQASSGYREFILKNTLIDAFNSIGGDK